MYAYSKLFLENYLLLNVSLPYPEYHTTIKNYSENNDINLTNENTRTWKYVVHHHDREKKDGNYPTQPNSFSCNHSDTFFGTSNIYDTTFNNTGT